MQIIKGSKAFTHRSPLALNAIMDRFQNTLWWFIVTDSYTKLSWFKVQFLLITYVSCTCTGLPFPMLVSNDISFTGPEWGILVVLRHSHTTFITVLLFFFVNFAYCTWYGFFYLMPLYLALNLRKFYSAFNKFIVHWGNPRNKTFVPDKQARRVSKRFGVNLFFIPIYKRDEKRRKSVARIQIDLITSMITKAIEKHEVLLLINHNDKKKNCDILSFL